MIKAASQIKPPAHIAIIMDGNGRWAKNKGFPRLEGHRVGSEKVRMISTACAELGVGYLTLYAFSSENWRRPQKEISGLMRYLKYYLKTELSTMQKNKIRFLTIGNIEAFSPSVQKAIAKTKESTAQNQGLRLILALNYGGRQEITTAARRLAQEVKEGKLKPEDINEDAVSQRLDTAQIPDPDLLIRTSGEMRISNFLLWQISYAEIYITPVLWPDFNEEELKKAILQFNLRDRRFGGYSRQKKGAS